MVETQPQETLNSQSGVKPRGLVPLWLKLVYTAFCAVLVPVYLVQSGPGNLLWFCDIALLGTMVALWAEHRLLASMMALCAVFLDLHWNIDFVIHLITGSSPMGFTGYMFNESIPLLSRLLSLFHCPLPFVQIWLVHRLGYAKRALIYQTLFGWAITWLTYGLSEFGLLDKTLNINRVYGMGDTPQEFMPELAYVFGMMGLMLFGFYLPVHLAFWYFCPVRTEVAAEQAGEQVSAGEHDPAS